MNQNEGDTPQVVNSKGRWPANLCHDGSEEVLKMFPNVSSGMMQAGTQRTQGGGYHGGFPGQANAFDTYADSGSAARFFYVAKASRAEREEGPQGMEQKQFSHDGRKTPIENPFQRNDSIARNHHPTIKPVSLIRYLVRLITPKGGISLDPFCGSGTHGIACKIEGVNYIDIDKEPEYVEIAKARIKAWRKYAVIDTTPGPEPIPHNQLNLL
jgi:site-specific DNA-methyltransferase (adenine-specific)